MATFPAIVSPPVSVSTVGTITYNELNGGLGPNFFRPQRLYINASSPAQLAQAYEFYKFRIDGRISTLIRSITQNPNLPQSAIDVLLWNDKLIIDGNTFFNFYILPYSWVDLIWYMMEYTLKERLVEGNIKMKS